MRNENQFMSDYAASIARLIDDATLALDRYTPADAAQVFGVGKGTVVNWIRKGYIQAEVVLSEKHHKETKKPREVYTHYIPASEIERIQMAAPKLIPYTKRVWPRYLYKLEHGEKVY